MIARGSFKAHNSAPNAGGGKIAQPSKRAQLKDAYASKLEPPKPESRCTDCAREDQNKFGGTIQGYYRRDNPTAMDLGDEGHDFLVTPDNFLIDRWIEDVWDKKPIYDLNSPADLAQVKALYGDPAKWKAVGKKNVAPSVRSTQ